MREAGRVACLGGRSCVYTVLVGRPEGKRPFGSPRHRWENIIKTNLQELGWRAWTGLIGST